MLFFFCFDSISFAIYWLYIIVCLSFFIITMMLCNLPKTLPRLFAVNFVFDSISTLSDQSATVISLERHNIMYYYTIFNKTSHRNPKRIKYLCYSRSKTRCLRPLHTKLHNHRNMHPLQFQYPHHRSYPII